MRVDQVATNIVDRIDLDVAERARGPRESGGVMDGFAGVLGQTMQAEKAAEEQAVRFASGDPQVGIHEVVIAAEKASLMVRFSVTLKNRAVEAYRELMNTPV